MPEIGLEPKIQWFIIVFTNWGGCLGAHSHFQTNPRKQVTRPKKTFKKRACRTRQCTTSIAWSKRGRSCLFNITQPLGSSPRTISSWDAYLYAYTYDTIYVYTQLNYCSYTMIYIGSTLLLQGMNVQLDRLGHVPFHPQVRPKLWWKPVLKFNSTSSGQNNTLVHARSCNSIAWWIFFADLLMEKRSGSSEVGSESLVQRRIWANAAKIS